MWARSWRRVLELQNGRGLPNEACDALSTVNRREVPVAETPTARWEFPAAIAEFAKTVSRPHGQRRASPRDAKVGGGENAGVIHREAFVSVIL